MKTQDQIQLEVDKTLSLLDNIPAENAPADFLSNLNARMEREKQVDVRFYRSTLLKVAAIVAFIAMNTFTWFSAADASEEDIDNYSETVFEAYNADWSNALSYE